MRRHSRRPHGRVVEVIGLPGAGKSTAVALVSARGGAVLTAEGAPLGWRGLNRVVALVRSPVFSLLWYATLLSRSGVSADNVRLGLAAQLRYLAVRERRDRANLVVLDEGPAHGMFIALYGTRESRLSRVLLTLTARVLTRTVPEFCWIDTAAPRIAEALRTREAPLSRFNSRSAPSVIDALATDGTYRQLVAALGARVLSAADPHAAAELLAPSTGTPPRSATGSPGVRAAGAGCRGRIRAHPRRARSRSRRGR